MFHAACLVALKDQPRRWDEAREKLRTAELQSDGSDTLDNWEFITQTRSMFDHALGLSDRPVCEAQRNRLIGMVSALEHECRHGHGMFSGSLEVDVPVEVGAEKRISALRKAMLSIKEMTDEDRANDYDDLIYYTDQCHKAAKKALRADNARKRGVSGSVGIEVFYAGQMGDAGRFVEIVWELEKVLIPGDNGDYVNVLQFIGFLQ